MHLQVFPGSSFPALFWSFSPGFFVNELFLVRWRLVGSFSIDFRRFLFLNSRAIYWLFLSGFWKVWHSRNTAKTEARSTFSRFRHCGTSGLLMRKACQNLSEINQETGCRNAFQKWVQKREEMGPKMVPKLNENWFLKRFAEKWKKWQNRMSSTTKVSDFAKSHFFEAWSL